MKVLIPVAGFGTRLRPHTYTTPKPLLMVAGKPIIGHVLDTIGALNPDEVIMVIGPMGERIIDYVRQHHSYHFRFVFQEEQLGLGHAVYLGLKDVEPAPLLIILGDTIIEVDLKSFTAGGNVIGTGEVEDPRRFGVVRLADGEIIELVEKSERPPSNIAIAGIYFFEDPGPLASALDEIITKDLKTRGEYQLTDGLALLLKKGLKLRAHPVQKWLDCGTTIALLETNRYLLRTKSYYRERKGVVIKSPVYIFDSARIEDSIVGPSVSIGENALIRNSVIRDSIINSGAVVEDSLIAGSIIGENARVLGKFKILNVGDSSTVEIT
ncbi:nucleotidyl transferase [candidate division WOR-3 bacterium]|uniref:Nucleotidyl transferase n=1 Tax=candidate division WOR-3 bacterium TaxID=2052148 RepID=A0A660SE51_UNCW3|nr:MAG: nucleotidyl transferase [candidate division WOR-3 bacterium]